MLIQGRYGKAQIFAENLEEGAQEQIKRFLDQDYMEGKKVKIMPDVHQGMGCVIGLTAEMGDIVIPNIVGVDIGCGILLVKLGRRAISLEELDRFIRSMIPSGTKIHRDNRFTDPEIERLKCLKHLKGRERFQRSLGTLGGGNHFIEIGKDSKDRLYLVIHSGSRNLGKQIADYYQKLAVKTCRDGYPKDLCYLKGKEKEDYLHDMKIAQNYAKINREGIAGIILREFYGESLSDFEHFHTIHNYIDFRDNITRKGAISAYKDEKLLIPINMRDGSILGRGKGNSDWNFSAPHGAGRLLSRRDAKKEGSLKEFRETMKGIYSTSVHEGTLDESPFAYKPMEEIIEGIGETVEIIERIIPIYNYKA
ncbi:RtcB family protein [Gudongella sp. DL1XJH-153]|uniref:RtcB family protein n=1 Tax=Gudongella sp. DL1XJH-153 TaxID=3409804 RepID=UPI003BB7F198